MNRTGKIESNRNLWKNEKVLCVATMGLFSGDGAGCLARLLKKYGAEILGGFHIRMPDSVCDVRLLKRSPEQNWEIIRAPDKKIEKCVEGIRNGIYPRDGLFFYDRIAGLLAQRLWYCHKTLYDVLPVYQFMSGKGDYIIGAHGH